MTFTATTAAKQLGIDPKTMVKRLRDAGHEIGRGSKYTFLQIVRAMTGDKEAEQIREIRARADLLEFERREKERELVVLAEVQSMIRDSFLPVRQRLMALPAEMAARCNPSDPQLAREALDRWLTDSLPIIRAGLPKGPALRQKNQETRQA